ncbi:D-glycerate dehydrogenase [Fusibacter paucivorans]|uniref:D-glycerate dehydrogenase n=1 Tax=Fusibacter paucivorans TaxID=76009 RepID=A0ABS5PMH0_9FIRM|nr:D-glycerate dehydrogenase [Fusibacter paucivorans]MBS7526375.1 D-glycerate dehydrogenase [Fusibacter paucivorans]
MSQKKIMYLSRNFPAILTDMMAPHFDLRINEADILESRATFLKKIEGASVLVVDSRVKIDAEAMQAAGPSLAMISNYAVGYNNIDIAEATKRGILVTNTPGVVNDATADIAWGLLFSIARRVAEGDRMIRKGQSWEWTPKFFLGKDIVGRTLGIIGAGRVGMMMAKRSVGFNMNVIYADAYPNEIMEKTLNAKRVQLETLYEMADFISVHTPLTPETKHMINDEAFDRMKTSAILINTSRGPVVDEKALIRALKSGKIWGAGLDVFENEPILNADLFELENLVMTPHIGTATEQTRYQMAELAANNVLDFLQGKVPKGIINREVMSINKNT